MPALPQTFEERVALCQACHGPTGQSAIPETPSIGGQPQFFAVTDDLRFFSAWISKLPPPAPPTEAVDSALFVRGRTLAGRHPCRICHNPDFSGREQMPRLAHQREEYLLKVMREYQKGTRIGYAGAMSTELQGLSDNDLRALAHFFSHFRAE